MNTRVRSLLAISAFAIILAACATPAATDPESTASPSASPGAPSEEPDASPEIAGTITIVDGVAVGGPGMSVTDAIAAANPDPVLVNGALYTDADGNLFLAESVTDASEPTFGGPVLSVVDYPFSADEWDLDNADLTGLQETNGVLFFEDKQLFGVVES